MTSSPSSSSRSLLCTIVSRSQETFEALVCAEALDVGQAVRCIRAEAELGSAQVARELADRCLSAQPTQVRSYLHRGQEDLRAAPDQNRRQGQN